MATGTEQMMDFNPRTQFEIYEYLLGQPFARRLEAAQYRQWLAGKAAVIKQELANRDARQAELNALPAIPARLQIVRWTDYPAALQRATDIAYATQARAIVERALNQANRTLARLAAQLASPPSVEIAQPYEVEIGGVNHYIRVNRTFVDGVPAFTAEVAPYVEGVTVL